MPGRERNFEKAPETQATDNGVPYDYWSVMHYGKDAFSNGNGSTIITNDPTFQDIIGQRYEISHKDILELNRLYECSECSSEHSHSYHIFHFHVMFCHHFFNIHSFPL